MRNSNIHFIDASAPLLTALALALYQRGFFVTVSLAPSNALSTDPLEKTAITPEQKGFFEHNITTTPLDCVVLGPDVQPHNVELIAAKKIGLPIYSYAEYIYHYAHAKQRILLIAPPPVSYMLFSMLRHVLGYYGRLFDYAMPSVPYPAIGFMDEAPFILLCGQGYLPVHDKPIDWLIYKPHIVLITGLDTSLRQPAEDIISHYLYLASILPKGGALLYDATLPAMKHVVGRLGPDVKHISYMPPQSHTTAEAIYFMTPQGERCVRCSDNQAAVLQALVGAQHLLKELAVTSEQFYAAIATLPVLGGMHSS